MSVPLIQIAPEWGVNYRPGYIGFEGTSRSPVHVGICWFTRHQQFRDAKVSHVFIVLDEDLCSEAHIKDGVCERGLAERFADPRKKIFFRKPRGWTPELGQAIVDTAHKYKGAAYDTKLIAAHAAAGTWLGRTMKVDTFLPEQMNDPEKFICSEWGARALDEQKSLADKGILARHESVITPALLFRCNTIFHRYRYVIDPRS